MTFPIEPEQGAPGVPPLESPPTAAPQAAPEPPATTAPSPEPPPADPGPPLPMPVLPAAAGTGPGGQHPRLARRVTAVVALVVLGLAGVGGGAVALVREMGRAATKSEVAAALATEIASRWQRLPAGKIFSATVSYLNAQNDTATARLVGIAPATSCSAALAPRASAEMRSLGCHTILRATYTDASGALAVTVGIGVMPSTSAASDAWNSLTPTSPDGGMRAVPIPGTITAGFSDENLGASGMLNMGPYVFLYASGYTDGLPGRFAQQNPELAALGAGVLGALESVLTSQPAACTMKDIRC